jgi:hypothetical protein
MKIDKFLILILLSISLLNFFTYWQFKRISKALPKIETPKIEIPKPETLFQTKTEIKEFVTPDGKLKFKYSSDWIEMPNETWQEKFTAEAKVLFFANKFKLEKTAFGSLIVQELGLEKEKSIKEIIKEMEKEVKEKGGEMKILESEIKENQGYLKAKIKKTEGQSFIFGEKIILGEKKAYFVTILSLENFWPAFESDAKEILNSAQLVE